MFFILFIVYKPDCFHAIGHYDIDSPAETLYQ